MRPTRLLVLYLGAGKEKTRLPRFFVTYEMAAGRSEFGSTIFNQEMEAETLGDALGKVRENLEGSDFVVSNDYWGPQRINGGQVRGVSVGLYVADPSTLPVPGIEGEVLEGSEEPRHILDAE